MDARPHTAAPLRKSTFRRQLTLVVSIGVVALALLSSLAASWQGSVQIRDTLLHQGERIALNLSQQSRLALLTAAVENADEAVNATLAFPDVVGLQIQYADGKILMERGDVSAIAHAVPTGDTSGAVLEKESDNAWIFVAPVLSGQKEDSPFEMTEQQSTLLGHVRVVQSKDTSRLLVRKVFATNFGIGFVGAFLLLLALRFLTGRLTRPLQELSDTMTAAENGATGLRAQVEGPNDIAHMALGFNRMMEALEERERELRAARDDALRFAQLKADFAATVSHEIRTPLNGVVGALDMLKASGVPQRSREFVDLAWDSSQYLLELIENILDFSRLEAGKLQLEAHEFELATLLEDTIDLVAPQALRKGLDIGYLIDADVAPRLCGDPRRLRQVLINLLGNAVKFTEHGEIAIHVRQSAEPDESGRSGVRFEVVDTGIGISEEAKQRVFESFTQADASTTRRFGGSGLGLSICKLLVRLMDGSIGVDSTPGGGSCFWFTALFSSGDTEPAVGAVQLISGRGQRVLVVDEADIVRRFLAQLLEGWGYEVDTARDGATALVKLRNAIESKRPYRVVMVDSGAHCAEGDELPPQIRALPAPQPPHLIGLNRFGQGNDDTSLDGHLAKPLRAARVMAAFALLEGEAARAAEPASPPHKGDGTVLLVEDNRTNQSIMRAMLNVLGFTVELAENGEEAVRVFKQHRTWDVILMDCNMPVMDGYQATAAIRALEAGQDTHTPIVAMTANTQPSDIEKCLEAGMDDHLAKPLTLSSLGAKLNRWIASRDVDTSTDAGPLDTDALRNLQPLDAEALATLREVLGDDLEAAILPFLEDMPVYLDELTEAIAERDAERVRKAAHAVRGASGNLGAQIIATLARDIEERAARHALDGLKERIELLGEEFATVRELLRAELHHDESSAPVTPEAEALVLVVDDDRSTRAALRHTLQRSGFTVAEASDGAQALSMLERITPDVILMDALMPNLDGFTTCAQLQESLTTRDIPVLMITALEDSQSIERAFAAGASDYLTKPLHLAVVNQRVKRIVEATRTARHVQRLAYHDTLTGLPNRARFTDQLARSITLAEQLGQSLAVLFLDLDRFKFVNDTLGHEIGDRLLVEVSKRIGKCVRAGDCVARLGGDEFTVLLDNLVNPSAASVAAHKIVRALAAPFEIDGHDIFVAASIGISVYPNDGEDVSTLLRRADTAMYRAKRGNAGFVFYEPAMEATVSAHLRLEADLRRALERDELTLYYQPCARTDDLRIVGMEALVRWLHPKRGMVPPVEFIPLAEETGVIVPIGEWVLRSACVQARQWMDAGIPDLNMSVNISGLQLRQANFVELLDSILKESRLPPTRLTLEITESVLMEHVHDPVALLRRIANLGVKLAIDDFGTGYSSLSYLKRFPVNVLKVDRSFVADAVEDADAAAIVSGIVALAQNLRLEVVAEGVETDAQRQFLASLRCPLFQGYLLAKPLAPHELEATLLAAQYPQSRFLQSVSR